MHTRDTPRPRRFGFLTTALACALLVACGGGQPTPTPKEPAAPAQANADKAPAAAVPDAIVGAGTVLTPSDLAAVAGAGAAFAISPGATDALLDAADAAPIPFLPGVATASELMRGLEHGLSRFKLFPAEPAGGVALLQSLAGPFPHARFCPTGGITLASAQRYLALPNVLTVGGSWMLPKDALDAGDWARIGALAREAAALRRGSG